MIRLTLKERLFVEFYLGECQGNATESARRAGYAHPHVLGTRKLSNIQVQAAIEAKMSDFAMPANEVVLRLSEIAAGSLEDFIEVNEDGGFSFDLAKARKRGKLLLVKKLKNKKETHWEGEGDNKEPVTVEQLEIELHDPLTALDKLGRYHGLFKDKVDITSNGHSVQTILYMPDNGRDPHLSSTHAIQDAPPAADPREIPGD